MAQNIGGGVECRVRMPGHRAAAVEGKGAKQAEQVLNRFVRVVAFTERVGNALGTLAFTWATVVLLGGYPTVLRRDGFRDFWCATLIVFLEAIRMFSRNNKLDYQLFFHTKGAFRRFGLNGLIVIVYLSNIFYLQILVDENIVHLRYYEFRLVFVVLTNILLVVVPPVLGLSQSLGALKLLPKPLHRAITIWSPLVAILLMIPSIIMFPKHKMAKWMVFGPLLLLVLLVTVSRLRFPILGRLVDSVLGSKKIFWHQLILKLSMLVSLVMLVLMPSNVIYCAVVFGYDLYALVVVSFGNLQIPATIARVALALWRLIRIRHDYKGDGDDANDSSKTNLEPSLSIFYGMVLGQGLLYVVACILQIFACIPRRFLARRSGLRGQWGMEIVSLYYAYALDKSMEGDVLAPKNVNLNNLAMEYCLNSYKPEMQLHGLRIMHTLLMRDETRKQLFSVLTNSTKTIARLIEMLGWSNHPEDITIRLFAAKVTSEIATGLRVITIPGTVQVVSALLDYGNQQQRVNPLLNAHDVEHEEVPDPIQNDNDNHDETLETREHTSQQGPAEQQKSRLFRCLQCIVGSWSTPREEPKPLTEKDLLPSLGMSILDGLIRCDQENCVEISRASGLIPKIISFTSYGRSMDTVMYTDTQRILMASSLKLLHSLTSIHGEIGITLRHKVSKNPFLPRNLADVLGDSLSSKELKKLVAGILRNVAIDGEARQVIGRNQVVISRLMRAFLTRDGSSSTESERLATQMVAGQALAMLAIDNVNNCLAMVREPKYEFIKELTSMIHVNRYRSVAASLLKDLCRHARPELKEHDLKEISYSLREVLERIMDAEVAELEILIGLSSQICQVIPVDFARELDQGQMKERFLKRLVDALNTNVEPSADCPGIRRVILEQAINLMEYDSCYVNCFNDHRMMEAVSMVEETASDVEDFRLFMGDAGLIETSEPLTRLAARAKQLMTVN